MPRRLDHAFLDDSCSKELTDADGVYAQGIAAVLGPLALPWMTADALRIAGMDEIPQRLPATVRPGSFHALVVTPRPFPALRPAFALPLRWDRDREHSRRLPASLLEHADAALVLYRAEAEGGPPGQWGLSLDFQNASEFDLSGLEIDGPSAMAAMFAALDLAVANIGAIGTVLASVSCLSDAWSSVAGVGAKLDAAVAAGATRVFLWDGNKADGEAWERSRGHIDFVRYLEAKGSLRESLAPFLQEVEAPPLPAAPLDQHAAYFERALAPRREGDAARDYYLETLVRPIADKCRNDPGAYDIARPVRCLVGCIAPGGPPAVALLARLLRPATVRLIHSPLANDKRGQLARDLRVIDEHLRREAGVSDVEAWEMDLFGLSLEALAEQLRKRFTLAIADGSGSAGGSPLVVDVTNGPKRLSMAVLKALARNALCVLVDSEQAGPRGHKIGTEQVVLIRSDGL